MSINNNNIFHILHSLIISVSLVIIAIIVSGTVKSYSKNMVGVEEKKMLIDAIDSCRASADSYEPDSVFYNSARFNHREYASCLRDKGYYDIAEQYSNESEVNQDDASSESEETVK